jgi:hypothetical protein
MSEFKYGDIVDCRNAETDEWKGPFVYVTRISIPNWGIGKMHITMWPNQNQYTFSGHVDSWVFVRKYEALPASEPAPTIEERLERLEKLILKSNNNE